MASTDTSELIRDFREGRITRGGFLTKALALGLSASAAGAVLQGSNDVSRVHAASPVTIDFMTDSRSEWVKLQKLLPAWTKKTGINLRWVQMQETPLRAKTTLELSAPSTSLSVIMVDFQLMNGYAKAGVLEPLDDYLAKSSTFHASDFQKPFLDALRYNGKLYALPLYQDCNILMYRADLFAKLGLHVPQTMTDLQNTAKALRAYGKSKGMYGIALRGQRGMGVNEWTFPTFLEAFGGRYYKNFPKDMHPVLDSPQAVQALTYYVNILKNYGPPGEANYSYVEVQNDMMQSRAAMIIDSATLGVRMEDPTQSNINGKVGYAMVPKGPAGRFPGFYTWAVVIPKGAPHKAEAAEFLSWLLSPTVAEYIGLSAPNQALDTVYNVPAAKYYKESEPLIKVMHDSLALADPDYRPRIPEETEVGTDLSIAIADAIAGIKTPAQALKDANAQITKVLQQAGYF